MKITSDGSASTIFGPASSLAAPNGKKQTLNRRLLTLGRPRPNWWTALRADEVVHVSLATPEQRENAQY